MSPGDDYQTLWVVYYVATGVFVVALVALCWRWRFAYIRFWLPCLLGLFAIIPLPVDEAHTHYAPLVAVWFMSLFV